MPLGDRQLCQLAQDLRSTRNVECFNASLVNMRVSNKWNERIILASFRESIVFLWLVLELLQRQFRRCTQSFPWLTVWVASASFLPSFEWSAVWLCDGFAAEQRLDCVEWLTEDDDLEPPSMVLSCTSALMDRVEKPGGWVSVCNTWEISQSKARVWRHLLKMSPLCFSLPAFSYYVTQKDVKALQNHPSWQSLSV